jgi:hypothetical protein
MKWTRIVEDAGAGADAEDRGEEHPKGKRKRAT